MKKINRWLIIAGVTGALSGFAGTASAQGGGGFGGGGFGGGGNFNAAQMQQQMQDQMLASYRETLEVGNDDDWNVIQDRIKKVLAAQQDTGFGGVGGMVGMFTRGRGGRTGGAAAGLLGGNSQEQNLLQDAVDTQAPKERLKSALDQFIKARKAKQAKLEKAQEDLRSVLTLRQEAIATLNGLL